MNDWQKTLYELMTSLPLKDELRDGLRTAILATPIQNMIEFTIARDAMLRIIQDIHAGRLTIKTTLREVYKDAYEKAIARPKIAEVQPKSPPQQLTMLL